LIFNEGAMVGGVFSGDAFITSYWGVSVLLNSGGFTNGLGGGNNSRSYDPGYSSFTINMRSSGTQTTFDRRLFTVRPDGTTTIKGITYINSVDNSYIVCGPNTNNYYLNVGSTSGASTTMHGTNTCGVWTSFSGALHLNPSTASNKIFINGFNTSGFLGVGSAGIADAKLHVGSGAASTGNIYQRYISLIIGDGTATQTLTDVCAIFDSSVWCKSRFTTSSDERIKKNIQDINDDGALQKILQIQPKTYEYIDKVERNDGIVYGFIAQQIKKLYQKQLK
jgi:hypothetical protein